MIDLKDFIFDKTPVSKFNVITSGESTWGSPEYDISTQSSPGIDGDTIIDNHRFKNFDISYNCGIFKDFKRNFPIFRSFLLVHASKYYKLEDNRHPNEFIYVYFKSISSVLYNDLYNTGTFTITFSARPQRYLKSGDFWVDSTKTFSIYNPSYMKSKPLIRFYGSGNIVINDTDTITISSNFQDYIEVDCGILEAYNAKNTSGLNNYVSFSTDEPITLHNGKNTISISGLTKVSIKPRWYV